MSVSYVGPGERDILWCPLFFLNFFFLFLKDWVFPSHPGWKGLLIGSIPLLICKGILTCSIFDQGQFVPSLGILVLLHSLPAPFLGVYYINAELGADTQLAAQNSRVQEICQSQPSLWWDLHICSLILGYGVLFSYTKKNIYYRVREVWVQMSPLITCINLGESFKFSGPLSSSVKGRG